MYETLLRPHEVYNCPPLQDITSIGEKLKKAEARREELRLKQIASNRSSASASGSTFFSSSSSSSGPPTNRSGTAAQKRKREEEEVNGGEEEVVDKMVVVVDEQDLHPGEEGGEVEPKRVRLDDEEDVVLDDSVPTPVAATLTMMSTNVSVRMGVSKAAPEVRGHTSYLTFACLIPFSPSEKEKEDVKEEDGASKSVQAKEEAEGAGMSTQMKEEEVTMEADIKVES